MAAAKKTQKEKTVTKKTAVKPKSPAKEKMVEKEMVTKIKVVGIGGSGKNAVNYMVKNDVRGVKFVAINTDAQDLDQSKATKKIHIGRSLTAGAGTGMNPEVGKNAAIENKDDIVKMLEDCSIVFITGGMGGGTGTGASPVVAQIAKEMGILTIAVVTKPFMFEGGKRMQLATEGIAELGKNVDAYIVIPNDKILEVADENTTMNDAFALSDDVLLQAVTGISNLITTPGRINIDASDVRTVLENQGLSLVGIGKATGDNRSEEAATMAINSPLLDVSVKGAGSVLFSITAGDDLKMSEVAKIAETITREIAPDATVKFGTIRDLKLKKGEVKVTVIASGFENSNNMPRIPANDQSHDSISSEDELFAQVETKPTTPATNKPSTVKRTKKDNTPAKEESEEDFWSLPSFLKKK